MYVQVKLYSIFRISIPDYDAERGLAVELQEGSCLQDLLEQLEIERHKLSMVRLNGRLNRDYSTILQQGDTVEIFPLFGGG